MLDLNHRIDEIRVLDYLFVMRHHFILLALFVTLLAASSCCDQRSTASAIKRDYLISVINSNLDLPISWLRARQTELSCLELR